MELQRVVLGGRKIASDIGLSISIELLGRVEYEGLSGGISSFLFSGGGSSLCFLVFRLIVSLDMIFYFING